VGQPFLEFGNERLLETASQFGNCLFLTRAPAISADSVRVGVPMQGNCCNRVDFFFSEPFAIRPDARLGDDPPTVELVAPQGGESFAGGGTIPITWTASDDVELRAFDLHASYDGGRSWHDIARNLGPATRRFDWQLPGTAGIADARVRVIARDLLFQSSASGGERGFAVLAGEPSLRITLQPRTTVVQPGDPLVYDVTVENLGATEAMLDGWIEARKPNGNPAPGSPLAGPKTFRIAPGRVLQRTLRIRIPASTPPSGPYRVIGALGSFPDGIDAVSSFAFQVVESSL